MLVPVVLVNAANAAQIDRERWVPIAQRRGIADALHHRRQIPIAARRRHNGRHDEVAGAGHELTGLFPDVVLHRDAVAWSRLEIVGRPLVQDDRRRIGRRADRRNRAKVERRDE